MTRARSITRSLIGAAFACHLGILLSVLDPGALGPWLTVIGIVWLVVSLHQLGRLGPDA